MENTLISVLFLDLFVAVTIITPRPRASRPATDVTSVGQHRGDLSAKTDKPCHPTYMAFDIVISSN